MQTPTTLPLLPLMTPHRWPYFAFLFFSELPTEVVQPLACTLSSTPLAHAFFLLSSEIQLVPNSSSTFGWEYKAPFACNDYSVSFLNLTIVEGRLN